MKAVLLGTDGRVEACEVRHAEDLSTPAGASARVGVVPAEGLARFRASPGFFDRGRKVGSRQLSRYLVGVDGIPLLEATYSSVGWLRSSVDALLRQVEPGFVAILGVPQPLFDGLVELAGPGTHGKQAIAGRPALPPIGFRALDGVLDEAVDDPGLASMFVGRSAPMQAIRRLMLRAAASDAPVLITGESGSGRQRIARTIDRFGRRRGKYLALHCGTLGAERFEAELLGERSSGTDGQALPGLWQLAAGGTLFLEDVGALSPREQRVLLDAIERRPRRGRDAPKQAPPRLIASASPELSADVQEGRFDVDLFYRLRTIPLPAPALRDHRSDIPELASHLWHKLFGESAEPLPPAVLEELQRYRWPGNANQLRAALGTLRALFGPKDLRVGHVRTVLALEGLTGGTDGPSDDNGADWIDRIYALRRLDEALRALDFATRQRAGARVATPSKADLKAAAERCRLELETMRDALEARGTPASLAKLPDLEKQLDRLASGRSLSTGAERSRAVKKVQRTIKTLLEVVLGDISELLDSPTARRRARSRSRRPSRS